MVKARFRRAVRLGIDRILAVMFLLIVFLGLWEIFRALNPEIAATMQATFEGLIAWILALIRALFLG